MGIDFQRVIRQAKRSQKAHKTFTTFGAKSLENQEVKLLAEFYQMIAGMR